MENLLTSCFVLAVVLATATRLWLALRQIRHVRLHRDSVPAGFESAIPLTAHRTAADYCIAKTRLGILDLMIGVVALLGLTLGGGLQALHDALAAVLDPAGLWHGLWLIVGAVLVLAALELPVTLWRTFVIEARFGFNRQTLGLFLADLARQGAVGAALGIPLIVLVLWLMAAMGPEWWLYVWGAWVAFNLLLLLAYPTVIAPLFNRFTPLSDPALAGRIDALLARCGFRASGLFVMDGSKRSNHGNAYFTGFGAAKRIVLFDTLLARLTPAEIEAVLAHELGHFSRHHVWKRVSILFATSLVLLWMLGQLAGFAAFYEGLGVTTPSTAIALLLFFLVVPVFTFFLQPLASLLSRSHEFEADAYAATHSSAADLVRALVRLYQDNAATLTPDPLYSAFYDSHPPAATRIARLQEATG
ncbi:MAG: peptidase M48 [Betaproteobacteria bacterium RIFCSPLOWO2_02_FULL_66_14]|nr:MAG: peptidase M48 [Betaproteobacteria bacterium RIFCSPLOWO2_02_FULL_66_14]